MNIPIESVENFERYTEALSDDVRANIRVVSPSSIGQEYMVRIDKEAPEIFTPRIPRNPLENEDISVPRICVSANFIEAVLGYGRMSDEFQDGAVGYQMSIFPFEFALKPTEKLVPEAEKTNEYWLVNYSSETKHFKPIKVGNILIVKYSEQLVVRLKRKVMLMELFIHVDSEMPVPIIRGKLHERGFYRVLLEKDNQLDVRIDTIDKRHFEEMTNFANAVTESCSTSYIDRW